MTDKLVAAIVEGIQEKKGHNIAIIDFSGVEGAIAHYFVVAEGNSPSQVEAVAESIGETVRKTTGEKPVRVIGLGLSHWVAMGYTDVLVHIFVPDVRRFYDLESLWQDVPIERVPDLVMPAVT